MNESYKDLKAYLLNEIAEDAQDMLNAIGDKDVDEIDDDPAHDEIMAMRREVAMRY